MPKEKETTKLCLIVEVEYDANGVPVDVLKDNLVAMVQREVGNGALTGETEAEVDKWNAYVSRFYRGFDDLPKIAKKEEEKEKKEVA